jgi:hypothetical protein
MVIGWVITPPIFECSRRAHSVLALVPARVMKFLRETGRGNRSPHPADSLRTGEPRIHCYARSLRGNRAGLACSCASRHRGGAGGVAACRRGMLTLVGEPHGSAPAPRAMSSALSRTSAVVGPVPTAISTVTAMVNPSMRCSPGVGRWTKSQRGGAALPCFRMALAPVSRSLCPLAAGLCAGRSDAGPWRSGD